MTLHKPVLAGLAGAAGLLTVYFSALGLGESLDYAQTLFFEMWYWVSFLAAGFGTQIGLHTYVRTALRQKSAGATASVAASGGVSTVAMLACCAHHLTDILPILGLSVASLFLIDYQLSFILLGVFSNLAGIVLMLGIIQKHGLQAETGAFKGLFALNMKRALNAVAISAVVVISLSFFATGANAAEGLAAQVDRQNRVVVKVEPVVVDPGAPTRFVISLNTHSGALDFDLTQISVLQDDRGNSYRPTGWDGSPPGGHHRSGSLRFPPLAAESRRIKLTIKDIYGVPERVFEWNLR